MDGLGARVGGNSWMFEYVALFCCQIVALLRSRALFIFGASCNSCILLNSRIFVYWLHSCLADCLLPYLEPSQIPCNPRNPLPPSESIGTLVDPLEPFEFLVIIILWISNRCFGTPAYPLEPSWIPWSPGSPLQPWLFFAAKPRL